MQQSGDVDHWQVIQGAGTAALQARFGPHASGHQCHQTAQGMAHQHDSLAASSAGPQLAEAPLALGRQHRLHIGQPIRQTFGSWKGPFAGEGVLHGGGVAAGMFHQHHRPAPLRQVGGQPIELIGIAAQARHQQ